MVLDLAPAPIEKSGFKHGAATAREEALLNAQKKQEEQTKLIKAHAGGSKNKTVTVPQVSTGASSDGDVNKHISLANETLMKQQAAAEFDKLALSNKVGGRKRKAKKTKRKSSRKSRKTRRNKRKN